MWTDAPTDGQAGRLGYTEEEEEEEEGMSCAYFIRRARAEPLQQLTEDHPILQGALQEGFRIRDGLFRRLQHPERDQPCNRLPSNLEKLSARCDALRQRTAYICASQPPAAHRLDGEITSEGGQASPTSCWSASARQE
ncbi:hypothetical protein GOODEAATRI_002007 [Goodea atripinnis]|uniref:Uncharacterized protein n=1 Tax=Goodea atripinnis TaxID=208336 RepID=A0ABV0MEC9_9TELE